MKTFAIPLSGLLVFLAMTTGQCGEAYMAKFQAYQYWSQHLPTSAVPDSTFLSFISSPSPLIKKLRERWLYQLARNKEWVTYSAYYEPTEDVNLQCLALRALLHQDKEEEALHQVVPLWLSGTSQPPVCDELFAMLLKSSGFHEELITKRLALALEKQNLPLARHLLKQYKTPRLEDAQLLTKIYLNPGYITKLTKGTLHDEFYLYGLKRLVVSHMDKAIKLWQTSKVQQWLNEKQQQSFLGHMVLYKAMRNHADTKDWFKEINPSFYTEPLLEWRIRFALKQQDWQSVERLIHYSQNKNTPTWQYWLARALEAQGKSEPAKILYQALAKIRNYYGFLASIRLHQHFNFEHEATVTDMQYLKPYQSFMQQIQSLYKNKQTLDASRLLNDFMTELPKEEKSALIHWLAHDLQWHGKAVNLSNSDDDLANQLSLRFPLAYASTIGQYTTQYQIPLELVYAIIRQESTFREDIVSPAGAYGLMQLMPATAQMTARNERIAYHNKTELFSASKNIHLGIAYLQQLAKRFNHHPLLIAAAYNAGPRQVTYWLHNHFSEQTDIWVETLPWQETRNYLKNIIAFYAVYQYRLDQKPDLSDFMKALNV